MRTFAILAAALALGACADAFAATAPRVSIGTLAQLATPLPSPNATVTQMIGVTKAEVAYSRPAVKGRTIWGELVPYDKVWRTGANASSALAGSPV